MYEKSNNWVSFKPTKMISPILNFVSFYNACIWVKSHEQSERKKKPKKQWFDQDDYKWAKLALKVNQIDLRKHSSELNATSLPIEALKFSQNTC